jgi:hypothetical protein
VDFFFGEDGRLEGVVICGICQVPRGCIMHAFCHLRSNVDHNALMCDMFVALAGKASRCGSVSQPSFIMMHFPANDSSPENLVRFVENTELVRENKAEFLAPFSAALFRKEL